MDLPVERIPTLVAGVGTLLLGIGVVAMSPRSPLHRAFGLFSGLRGGMLSLQAFSSPADDVFGRMSVYLLLALPMAAAWLGYVLERRLGQRRRSLDVRLASAMIAATMVFEAAYLLDHALYFDGPLETLFFGLQFATYAAVGLLVVRAFSQAPEGPGRRGLYPFALGFLAEPVYFLASQANLLDLDAALASGAGRLHVMLLLLTGALCGSAALLIGLHCRYTSRQRHDRWRFLSVLAAAVVSGLVVSYPWSFILFNAFWTLVLVAATVYAILRYRLFTMDLRVKAFMRHGSTAAIIGGGFVVVSEGLEDLFGATTMVGSISAAAVVAAALFPVHRLTRRLANRLMPGVRDSDAYRSQRRLDIYRAALEQAWLDGQVTPLEEEALSTLWKTLGIPGRDAQRLEEEVRITGGAS